MILIHEACTSTNPFHKAFLNIHICSNRLSLTWSIFEGIAFFNEFMSILKELVARLNYTRRFCIINWLYSLIDKLRWRSINEKIFSVNKWIISAGYADHFSYFISSRKRMTHHSNIVDQTYFHKCLQKYPLQGKKNNIMAILVYNRYSKKYKKLDFYTVIEI